MATFLFSNTVTGETKMISSKDSVTAKRVYTTKYWKYVKAVPKPINTTKKVSKRELFSLVSQLVSEVHELKNNAIDYDVKFAKESALSMERILMNLKSQII